VILPLLIAHPTPSAKLLKKEKEFADAKKDSSLNQVLFDASIAPDHQLKELLVEVMVILTS
jgi:hypothetical protein